MPARILLAALAVLATSSCGVSSPGTQASNPCISNINVDTTEVKDERTILFHMRDRSVYRNTLPDRCFGLMNETRGFTYSPTDNNDALCSNLVLIRLNTYGTTCALGAFERVK